MRRYFACQLTVPRQAKPTRSHKRRKDGSPPRQQARGAQPSEGVAQALCRLDNARHPEVGALPRQSDNAIANKLLPIGNVVDDIRLFPILHRLGEQALAYRLRGRD